MTKVFKHNQVLVVELLLEACGGWGMSKRGC